MRFICTGLPNDKMLDLSKLKAFADDKLIIIKMMISFFHTVENTVGKGENAGSVFTNHSLECSLSYTPDFSIL